MWLLFRTYLKMHTFFFQNGKMVFFQNTTLAEELLNLRYSAAGRITAVILAVKKNLINNE